MMLGYLNYRNTRNPLAVLLVFCFLAPIMCAFLHQGERWRHLWLFVGLLWGFRVRNFLPDVSVRSADAAHRPPCGRRSSGAGLRPGDDPAGAEAGSGRGGDGEFSRDGAG